MATAAAPANGAYDFSFFLYADAAGTQWVADADAVDNVSVVDGLFTTLVDVTDPLYGDVYFYLNGDTQTRNEWHPHSLCGAIICSGLHQRGPNVDAPRRRHGDGLSSSRGVSDGEH